MKVLFQSRLNLFDKKGGDTVQMLETKKALEELGVAVDISCELFPNVSKYNLVHVFNLDWVCEPYLQIKNAKKQGKKVVLSPIHHSLVEFKKYEKLNRWGLSRVGNVLLPNQPARDVAKNLIKGVLYPKKLYPAIYQLLLGIRKEQQLSVAMSDIILVQTTLEAEELKLDYETSSFEWKKVVNGINLDIFGGQSSTKKEKTVLSVGRIEPRKNQINLVLAFNKAQQLGELTDYKLVFIGKGNSNHPTYLKDFNKILNRNKNIEYLGYVKKENMCNLYHTASIFALPSWFETTGLVLLEAGVCGVPSLVATGDRAGEYLNNNALYCDPASIDSICNALILAQKPTVSKEFPEFVKKTYTWENCAKDTLAVYKQVLD